MLVIKHAMYVNKKKLLRELRTEWEAFNGPRVKARGKQARPCADPSTRLGKEESAIADDYFYRGWGRAMIAVSRALQMDTTKLEKELERD